ncbi:hypothetical protein [Streptomyces sp. NPDC001820]|uniref:hypothetical protein n=1 Tax=Streptomyces sp. NPDC001820 TaxID=3364613 RepID=UPI0036C9A852
MPRKMPSDAAGAAGKGHLDQELQQDVAAGLRGLRTDRFRGCANIANVSYPEKRDTADEDMALVVKSTWMWAVDGLDGRCGG